MSDSNKSTEERLLEKIDEKDREIASIKKQLEKQRTWYKNPAMITAIVGLLAGAGTTIENMYTRWLDRQQLVQHEKQAEDKFDKDDRTNKLAYRLMLKRTKKVEDTCIALTSTLVEVMTPDQRRKVVRKIDDLGLPELRLTAGPPVEAMKTPDVYETIQRKVQSDETVDLDDLEDKLIPPTR